MTLVTTILLPTRPQPDTVVAIFILKKFGKEQFPGIDIATVALRAVLNEGETFESLLEQGILAIDLAGGMFDHHASDACASEMVAEKLGVRKDPALSQLLTYARRDDKEGKGTMSADGIDRAFGLSGLIASLNKTISDNPNKIVETILPLLEAHYLSAKEHRVELPQDVERLKKEGKYYEFSVKQNGKTVKVACVVSDKPSMAAYLRSMRGPHVDVVVQKAEKTNHFCILSRQERNIDLSMVMALIRLREADLRGITLNDQESYLTQTGRIDEVSHWYLDPATNSILNGGAHNKQVEESVLAWEELQKIVREGLRMGTTAHYRAS